MSVPYHKAPTEFTSERAPLPGLHQTHAALLEAARQDILDRGREPGADAALKVVSKLFIQGNIDQARLNTCLEQLIKGLPHWFSSPHKNGSSTTRHVLAWYDISNPTGQNTVPNLDHLVRSIHTQSINKNGALAHLWVIISRTDQAEIWLATHRLASDDVSHDLFWHQLFSLYQNDTHEPGTPPVPAPVDHPLPLPGLEEIKEWKNRLHTANQPLQISPQTPQSTNRISAHYEFELSPGLSNRIHETTSPISRQAFFLSVFQTLLFRYTSQSDFLTGICLDLRNDPELADTFAPLQIILPQPVHIDPSMSFSEFLKANHEETHLSLQLPEVDEVFFRTTIEPIYSDYQSRFSHTFQYRIGQNRLRNGGDTTWQWVQPSGGRSEYPLNLTVEEVDTCFSLSFDYNPVLFNPAFIARMGGHFITLLQSGMDDPTLKLSRLPMLTNKEREHLIFGLNHTQKHYAETAQPIHAGVEEQAALTPDAIAVIQPATTRTSRREITYTELNERANQLAHRLIEIGAGPEKMVGISIERSVNMIIGLLGILKSGAAYLPLDPDYPEERLKFILQDTQPTAIVTTSDIVSELPADLAPMILLDGDIDILQTQPLHNPDISVAPENLAYIIYTSGSTGTPKGVEVTHQSVVNHNRVILDLFDYSPGQRAIQFSTINFDASVEEIFPPLIAGLTLVLRPNTSLISGAELFELIDVEQVNILDMPTAYWHELVHEISLNNRRLPGCVRTLLTGGEKASAELLREWHKHGGVNSEWANTYGPTEATIICSAFIIPAGSPVWNASVDIPIGKPIPNACFYILDEFMQPVPIGVTGELYVGGSVLARGYHNRPDLTTERFLPDPFRKEHGARIYRTGDLARYLENGDIEFLGRSDHQIKVRGFRIEPAEVEYILEQHEEVEQALVIGWSDNPKQVGKRLVAYIKLNPSSRLTQAKIKEWVENRLPFYMTPSAFVFLDAFPLTPNAKIDLKALPPPTTSQLEHGANYTAPRNEVEAQLVRIWEEHLRVEPIGICDDFFDLGGDSLLALRLFGRIERDLGASLPLSILLNNPTIEYLAELIHYQPPETLEWSALVPIQPLGSKPPFFGVHGLDGNVLFWRSITRYLGTDQPFFGLQARGVDGLLEPNTNYSVMAAEYISEIKKLQPQGPYYLGGFSLGGEIAFEMAQQLIAAGEQVALLVMFDTETPARPVRLMQNDNEEAHNGNEKQPSLPIRIITKLKYHWLLMKDLSTRGKLVYILHDLGVRLSRAYLAMLVRHYRRRKQRLPDNIRVQHMAHHHEHASQNYNPHPYPGKVTLFRASESIAINPLDHPLGWKPLALGGIDYYVFDSTHRLVDEEYAEEVGMRLEECLAEARSPFDELHE